MAELTGLLDGDGGEGRDKEELCRLIRSRAGQPQEKRQDQDLPSFVPYNLLTQHSIPDKSVADCAEALIGAYLVATGQRGALLFMSWIGLEVRRRRKKKNILFVFCLQLYVPFIPEGTTKGSRNR